MPVRALSCLATWFALLVLWLLFVDTLAPAEVLVGAGAAALAATGSVVAEQEERPRFRSRLSWLAEFRRVPWLVMVGCGVLARRLVRLVFRGDRSPGLLRQPEATTHGPRCGVPWPSPGRRCRPTPW